MTSATQLSSENRIFPPVWHASDQWSTHEQSLVEEDPGTAYAFEEGQRVRKSYPAVAAFLARYRPLDEADAFLYPAAVAEAE